MAGGAQGGGGRPAQPGPMGQPNPMAQASPMGQPQINPQAFMQYQNALQNYRQGSMGMPSQVPGANIAAPGGDMASTRPTPVPQPLPQQVPPPGLDMASTRPTPVPQMGPQGMPITAGVSTPLPGSLPEQAQPRPMQQPVLPQRQNFMAGRGPMPQIQGNPNSMPVQRPMRGRGGYG